MNFSFWKIFSLFGFVSGWAEEALSPDEDGKVRITIEEMAELAEGICRILEIPASVEVPYETAESVKKQIIIE